MTRALYKLAEQMPVRRHFLADWLEDRRMEPMDLVAALNDPDKSLDLPEIDKSQVYRWLKGQMPQNAQLPRIVAALGLDDASDLFRHPVDGWFSRFIEGRREDEQEAIRQQIDLMKQQLQLVYPRKTGTGV